MIKILGWILFFYIIYTLLKNFLGPMLSGGSRQKDQYAQPGDEYSNSKPGETTIRQRPENTSHQPIQKDDGEYIDYKEIK